MARWFVPFQAIDPRNLGSYWTVGVSERHYKRLQNSGHEKAIARLLLVRYVLEGGTSSIFEGWSRPDKEGCFVYAGYPKQDFQSLRIEIPVRKGLIFLVFVLPSGEVDEWTWRCASDGGESRPDGVRGKLIWSVNPS